MIVGIGVDSVEVARFAHWHTYSQKALLRIFSHSEIEYCLSVPVKSAERFAVRFAAREALFKAYSSWQPDHQIPFLTFCRATTIIKKNAPYVIIDPQVLSNSSNIKISLSLTHSKNTAIAFIILELLSP
ncbi:holo-ACP synthase [soil metagenome]